VGKINKIYSKAKDFVLGTYLTTHERIDRDNPNLSPREYHIERVFREGVQQVGGTIEFFTPLLVAIIGNSLDSKVVVNSALVAALPCILDGRFRQMLYTGIIGSLRKSSPLEPPENYFVGKF